MLKPKHYIDVCFVHCFASVLYFSIYMAALEEKTTGQLTFLTEATD